MIVTSAYLESLQTTCLLGNHRVAYPTMSIVASILDTPILDAPLRLLRCIFGVASPSLAAADYGRRVKDDFNVALLGKVDTNDAPNQSPVLSFLTAYQKDIAAMTTPSWLDRWELRLARSVKWPPVIHERVEVQVIEQGGLTTALFPRVVSSVDVTGRSDRATRRVLNKWRRRCKVGGEGYEARVVKVWW